MQASRRDKGTGSVFYVPSIDKWRAKLVVDGTPMTRTVATEKEARQKLKELIRNQGTLASEAKHKYNTMAFQDYMKLWLETYKAASITPASLRSLQYDLEHYAVPYIGTIHMNNISTKDVQKMINGLIDEHHSLSVIKRVKSSVNSCLKKAVALKDIPFNPCDQIEMPSARTHEYMKRKEICILTGDEIDRYIARATYTYKHGKPMYRIGWGFVLILATGMRREEAAGLMWKDVDIKKGTIKICRTASFVSGKEKNGPKTIQIIKENAKSKSGERTIPLSQSAVNALLQLKHATGDYDYVLGVNKTDPINMSTLGTMHDRIMEGADISRPKEVATGLHALRHTFCSHLIMSDPPMDIKTISEIMGHADTRITLDVYGHIFDERKKQVVQITDFIRSRIKKL